ncbi:HIT family protein [Cytobacillus suaedae]|nr:HIT family protein [Cytobacillus suaedae]
MINCSLCNVESIEGQQVIVENDYCLFLQMPQEVLIGSGLIIPREHRETLFEITKQEWDATYELLHKVKQLLDDRYQPDGYNVGWNCGQVGGQHIFHAHLHVIPRFKDEPYAGRGIRSWLKSEGNKRW